MFEHASRSEVLFLRSTASSVFLYADETTLIQLFFLAIVSRMTAKYLAEPSATKPALIVGGAIFPVYFFHRFSSADDFASLLDAFLRAVLILVTASSVAAIVVTVILVISNRLRQFQTRILKEMETRRQQRMERD